MPAHDRHTQTPLPDLHQELAAVTADADRYRRDLSEAQHELSAALDTEDYRAADRANAKVADLQPRLLLAEASKAALADVLQRSEAQAAAGRAAAIEAARRQAAEGSLGEAMATEDACRERVEQLFAEAMAGLEAVRQALTAARQAEREGTDARHLQAEERAAMTGAPSGVVVEANYVSSRIHRGALLTAILRNIRTP
ncbi:hypothetical protein ACIGXI_09120 [Kitasatospora aureofaciens]|uniref:hypothetical protein n=1 Tax=Kitasatospora aureofaciens TaxID=1894 RepID=UPI0037C790E4